MISQRLLELASASQVNPEALYQFRINTHVSTSEVNSGQLWRVRDESPYLILVSKVLSSKYVEGMRFEFGQWAGGVLLAPSLTIFNVECTLFIFKIEIIEVRDLSRFICKLIDAV